MTSSTTESGRVVFASGGFACTEIRPVDIEAILVGPRQPDWAPDYPGAGAAICLQTMRVAVDNGLWAPGRGAFQIRHEGTVIGEFSFHTRPFDGVVEIGYGLRPSARGRGLMVRCLREIVAWSARQPDLRVLTATTDPDNVASRRTLARAGFELVHADDVGCRYRCVLRPDIGADDND